MSDFIRRRELDFLLFELFDLDSLLGDEPYAHLDRDAIDAVVDTAIRVADDHYASNAAFIDEHEPELVDGSAVIDDSVRHAIRAFADAGFISGGFSLDDAGMGLPQMIVYAYTAIFNAANVATAGYGLLTVAAANLLRAYGAPELVDQHFDDMLAGRTLGTMALSEPDAGSSLGDLRTTARLQEDGTYRLFGNKMWISGAGHDLTDNILHFVLARIEDAPPGTRGISLFAVPRWLDDGTERKRNDVQLAGLNHKMGYRGITNCALNFGEHDGAVGWIVGEPHNGLRYMFQMMNEARIEVGLAACMSAHAAYLYAVDYARERRQGRHPDQRDFTEPPIPIIEHADVRRMLLQQRAYIEAGWAMCAQCARWLDDARAAQPQEAAELHKLVDLLTPVAKAWPSKFCLQANELAMQVLGGYGYSREYPLERHYRDNRLNAIHEGTNGIQAMDLLGRKVAGDGGAALRSLMERLNQDVQHARAVEALSDQAEALDGAAQRLVSVSMAVGARAMSGDIRGFLADASLYLDVFGHVVAAWMWLRMSVIAIRHDDDPFYVGKLAAAEFFFARDLPLANVWCDILEAADDTPLRVDSSSF